jgi:hypothetical protein
LVGVAVKVAEEPAHIGLVPEVSAIATEGTSTGFTVMVMPALVAVVGLAQVALEVSIQVTTWPLVNVVVVNVALLVPAFTPFTCHC